MFHWCLLSSPFAFFTYVAPNLKWMCILKEIKKQTKQVYFSYISWYFCVNFLKISLKWFAIIMFCFYLHFIHCQKVFGNRVVSLQNLSACVWFQKTYESEYIRAALLNQSLNIEKVMHDRKLSQTYIFSPFLSCTFTVFKCIYVSVRVHVHVHFCVCLSSQSSPA